MHPGGSPGPSRAGTPGPGPAAPEPLHRVIASTGLWRLFPLVFLGLTPAVMVVPYLPQLLTDFFASAAAGEPVACGGYRGREPAACVDAHSAVTTWQAWASFVSQSVLSFLINPVVGALSDRHGRVPFLVLAQLASLLPLLALFAYLHLGVSLLWIFPGSAVASGFSSLTVSLAYAADLTPAPSRPAVFGAVSAATALSFLAGPVLAGLIGDPARTLHVAMGILACGVLASALLPESRPHLRHRRWWQRAGPPAPSAGGAARASLEERGVARSETEGLLGAGDAPSSGDASSSGDGGRAGAAPGKEAGAREAGGGGAWARVRATFSGRLFRKLTLVVMLQGMCLEGLQDLLLQYLQMRVGFEARDQAAVFVVLGACGFLGQLVLLPAMLRVATEKAVLVVGLCASSAHMLMLVWTRTRGAAFAGLVVGSVAMLTFPAVSSLESRGAGEAEQGAAQGALVGARSLAMGVGPLVFARVFAAFTRSDRPPFLPFFPGAPFLLGAAAVAAAAGIAATVEVDGPARRRTGAGQGGRPAPRGSR